MTTRGDGVLIRGAIRHIRLPVPEASGGRLMDGIHLLGEWYGCPAETPEFTRADALRTVCLAATRDAGLTVVMDRCILKDHRRLAKP